MCARSGLMLLGFYGGGCIALPDSWFSSSRSNCRALHQAGLNMIRLWGGAAVARDAFYDACDEAGLMVRHILDGESASLHTTFVCMGSCVGLNSTASRPYHGNRVA